MRTSIWPRATPLAGRRVLLEPLRVEHADALAPLLDDPALHAFTGGSPATASELRERYARQVLGRSPDGSEGWLNWVVHLRDDGIAVGIVQATLRRAADATTAELAWIISTRFQGRGLAKEAAQLMSGWLRMQSVHALVAHVHPNHEASAAVARSVGLAPTDVVVDGEIRFAARQANGP